MVIDIPRKEDKAVKAFRGWTLVYGRRKVGKTYTLKKSTNWDAYMLALKSGQILSERRDGSIKIYNSADAAKDAALMLKNGNTVIMDEFQRLSEEDWSVLALAHPNGRLMASGSSFGMLNKIFDKRSPMLGLFQPFRIGLISYADTVAALHKNGLDDRMALLWGTILRDPWIVPMVDIGKPPHEELARIMDSLIMASEGLVSEVFEEEDRALTKLYDSVLRLIANGLWRPAEIAGVLSSTGAIKGGMSTITGILDKLVKMGLVERIRLLNAKGSKYYYRLASPIVSIAYYMDQRYRISESNAPAKPKIVEALLGREAERSVSELLSMHSGLESAYAMLPEGTGDIDIVLLDKRGKKPVSAYELKTGPIGKAEAEKAVSRMHSLGIADAYLASMSMKPENGGAKAALGPRELIDIAVKASNADA